MKTLTDTFQYIFANNAWRDPESVSGPGSTIAATKVLRDQLATIFMTLNVKSIVDAPCGDFNWMRHVNYKFQSYIGIDIVPELIDKLRSEVGSARKRFQVGNIVTDLLPTADVIFCRDCLVHLPNDNINEALDNFRNSGFKYLMSTTFPKCQTNNNISAGDWRPINLQIEPFLLERPLTLIAESPHAVGSHADKSIGVWCL
jgi:SAM-dependent methyltransferase